MPFTIDDVRDLVRILEEKPEWRAELRRLMLSDDLAALREQIEESRLASERRIDRINEEIAELRAATERHTHSIRELSIDVSDLKGVGLEERYRRMAPAYFSRLIRRARVMRQDQFTALVEQAVTDGVLSTNEASDLLWVDLVVSGRRQDDGHEVFLVVEVSWTVGVKDVERAAQRAALFGRIRPPVLAVAAGKFVSEEVVIRARGENVWVFLDGRATPPDRTEIGP